MLSLQCSLCRPVTTTPPQFTTTKGKQHSGRRHSLKDPQLVAIASAFDSAHRTVADIPVETYNAQAYHDMVSGGFLKPGADRSNLLLLVEDQERIKLSPVFNPASDPRQYTVDDRVLYQLEDPSQICFIQVWRRALNTLNLAFHYAGGESNMARYARECAMDLLECRDNAASHVDRISDELCKKGYEQLVDGILEKIRFLERFKVVYEARGVNSKTGATHHRYQMKMGRYRRITDTVVQEQLPVRSHRIERLGKH